MSNFASWSFKSMCQSYMCLPSSNLMAAPYDVQNWAFDDDTHTDPIYYLHITLMTKTLLVVPITPWRIDSLLNLHQTVRVSKNWPKCCLKTKVILFVGNLLLWRSWHQDELWFHPFWIDIESIYKTLQISDKI